MSEYTAIELVYDTVPWLVAVAVILATLIGLVVAGVWFVRWLQAQKKANPVNDAFDKLDRSLTYIQRQQTIMAGDLADLKRKHDGLLEILIEFIADREVSLQKINILRGDPLSRNGGISFHDPKLSALLGTLPDSQRDDLVNAEIGLLGAEVDAIERYAGMLLNRVIATRGLIAQVTHKHRKTGAVALLRQIDGTYHECEKRLHQLNEPAFVGLYDGGRTLGSGTNERGML